MKTKVKVESPSSNGSTIRVAVEEEEEEFEMVGEVVEVLNQLNELNSPRCGVYVKAIRGLSASGATVK